MILVDTGPIVALFNPADADHQRCVDVLRKIHQPIATTVPVLTEAFHLLHPASVGARRLTDFLIDESLRVLFLEDQSLARAFQLMQQYADAPMDLADASLVAMAERLNLRTVFTIDRRHFRTYRIQRGHRYLAFELIG